MIVISGREFRAKQGKYLGLAAKGEKIILKSRNQGSFRLVPVSPDDTLMSEEAFRAKLDRAKRSIEAGEGTIVRSKEELQAYLDSL